MGIFVKKIKCPKCKSVDYTKVNLEGENGGVTGEVFPITRERE